MGAACGCSEDRDSEQEVQMEKEQKRAVSLFPASLPSISDDGDDAYFDAHLEKLIGEITMYGCTRHNDTIEMLDIGCGIGKHCAKIKERFGDGVNILGVDISGEMIKESVNLNVGNGNAFTVANFEKYDFGLKRKFHIIYSVDVFGNFLNPKKCVSKIRGLLEDNGIVVIISHLPNNHSPKLGFGKPLALDDYESIFTKEHWNQLKSENLPGIRSFLSSITLSQPNETCVYLVYELRLNY